MRSISRCLVAAIAFWLVALVAFAPVVHAAVRRVFVTSVSGSPILGDWPDAGAATGLAAGDAICQARAAAGGLPNASGYRAWLSSSTNDAYCRLHGLTGKKATNCGQPTLPEAAGPWLRVDDVRFAAAVPELLEPSNVVLLPPRIDELGAVVHDQTWTGTRATGEVIDGFTCGDWSAGTGNVAVGSSDGTGSAWTYGYSANCQTVRHLLCVEIGVGDPLPPGGSWGRLAFATSASGSGNLASWPQAGGQTGLAAGNAICRNLATTAGLPNPATFKAWLSTGAVDARDRFVHDGPWMRIDRVRVAADLADLTDGYLRTAINLSETGDYDVFPSYVWTGTAADGTAEADHCNGWTSADPSADGRMGRTALADEYWTTIGSDTCDSPLQLLCLQDLPLVFGDGFESGNTSLWSAAVP